VRGLNAALCAAPAMMNIEVQALCFGEAVILPLNAVVDSNGVNLLEYCT